MPSKNFANFCVRSASSLSQYDLFFYRCPFEACFFECYIYFVSAEHAFTQAGEEFTCLKDDFRIHGSEEKGSDLLVIYIIPLQITT